MIYLLLKQIRSYEQHDGGSTIIFKCQLYSQNFECIMKKKQQQTNKNSLLLFFSFTHHYPNTAVGQCCHTGGAGAACSAEGLIFPTLDYRDSTNT